MQVSISMHLGMLTSCGSTLIKHGQALITKLLFTLWSCANHMVASTYSLYQYLAFRASLIVSQKLIIRSFCILNELLPIYFFLFILLAPHTTMRFFQALRTESVFASATNIFI